MCFHSKLSKSAQEIEHRFNAKFEHAEAYQASIFNGFTHPKTPVITNKEISNIQLFQWGLIPFWAKDDSIKKNTLNARIESITEKPAYRNSTENRCLILVDGFYEWQWLDEKGKKKQKYVLTMPNETPFALAGLWSEWTNKQTDQIISSYTILTCEADELMSKIHNSKKRMPVIVSTNSEKQWLQGQKLKTHNNQLIATQI